MELLPLYTCLKFGNLSLAKLFLENPFFVKQINTKFVALQAHDGSTFLLQSLKRNYVKIAELLTEKGAEIDSHKKREVPAISLAQEKGYMSIVEKMQRINKKVLHES